MESFRCPKIMTKLPGPKSKKLISKDERHVSQSYTRMYPAVIDHAQGAYLWDVDGNCYIDFHTGIGVCSTGNAHPKVVEAIKNQAEKAIHIPRPTSTTSRWENWRRSYLRLFREKTARKPFSPTPGRKLWRPPSSWLATTKENPEPLPSSEAFTAEPWDLCP